MGTPILRLGFLLFCGRIMSRDGDYLKGQKLIFIFKKEKKCLTLINFSVFGNALPNLRVIANTLS